MHLLEKKNIDGLSLLTFPFLDKYQLFCGFTSRDAGYSKKPYDSLNLAYHVGDEKESVRKNRELILKRALYPGPGYIYSARQVHGDNIIYIGKGIKHSNGDIQEDADGLMTDQKNMPVMVMGADCSLLVIADLKNRAVCAVHSGWKGTLDRVVLKTLKVFCGHFGSNKCNIDIFIGPGIRKCCYQIGEDLAGSFRDVFGGDGLLSKGCSQYLDLAELNRMQIREFGIPEKNIFDTRVCTGCDGRYYSYRREGVTGRQAAIAMVS